MQTDLQLSNTELSMMQEVFSIIAKYKGKTRQFGLQLVHSHFDLKSDEVLYETHDATGRILTISPVVTSQFVTMPLATAWNTTGEGDIEVAMFCCSPDDNDNDEDQKMTYQSDHFLRIF